MRGLIQDQSERTVPHTSHTAATGGAQAQGSSGYANSGAAGGSALRARLPDSTQAAREQPQEAPEDSAAGEVVAKRELTLQSCLSALLAEHGLVGHLLEDLARYCESVHQHV